MGMIIGGGNRIDLYNFTNAVTPTVGTLAITLDQNVTTTVERDEALIYSITVEHTKDDTQLYTFLESAQSISASATTEEIIYEDGTKITAASSGTPYLALVAGGVVKGGADAGKKKLFAGLQAIANTSGSYSQTADTYTKPSFDMAGVAALGTITIPSSLLTNFMTTPATLTIPSTLKYGRVFFG